MNRYTGFSDLCIPSSGDLKSIIREAIDLGYRNVAIEQTCDLCRPEDVNKKQDPIPVPYCLKELKAKYGGQIKLVNRLTVAFSDASVSLLLNKSNNLRAYNLVAALPTNESSFQYACQTLPCDIITYNSGTIQVRMNRKYYYLAVERNIVFEIKYAPAIVSSADRKRTIERSHRYHAYGKSKNVIISSGAQDQFQLRSPYDIANLGLIFGLSEEQSKESVRGVANRVLLSAEGRRFGKAGVVITGRAKRPTIVDSDDYSDTELEENISDSDESGEAENVADMDVTNEDNEDDLDAVQPPKKKGKQEKMVE
ncbi:ribonuclease P protein subunit p30-like [Anopheles cruzii]|uniref:ribonuclease P protein subunit p30-like n=1 Tax=Anopheles cruzii TaxID=68878 RepID=UPI0022EC446C|nr:ribonuclease P protein subunit p30-like [Anopheles cruzii]